MAKFEKKVDGNFDDILSKIEDGILSGSISATMEDASDFSDGLVRCSVRIFERYSYSGSNRVSLSVTLFQNSNEEIFISAITSGGSQGVLFKINKIGENTFLDKLMELL